MSFPPKTDREAILSAALAIVESQGWAALSMRELGRRLGVRPSSLYHHFSDRNALEEALGAKVSIRLRLELEAASKGQKGRRRVQMLASAYVNFARQNQALYPLIVGLRLNTETHPEGIALWNDLVDANDNAAAVALWSFLHGYVVLEAAGKFGRVEFERGLSALLRGLAEKENIL